MGNKVSYTNWLHYYEFFVSEVWKNNYYTKKDQIALIDKLLNAITDNENNDDIINARNNIRSCLFLLKLSNDQEVRNVKTK